MADNNARHPDGLALSGGLFTLAVSIYILADGFPGLRVEWIVAAATVGVGVIMLIASVRARRDR